MKKSLAIAFLLGLAPVAAQADATPTADQILKLQDDAYSNFDDLTTETKMTVREPNETSGREYRFVTISRKDGKRVVRFLSPGDVKGMGTLIESRDTMYAYLPGFHKVRRLGTHVKNQSFMGSDASFEDMADATLTGVYKPTLVGGEGDEWLLDLALLPGRESEYPKKKIWIDKKIHMITKIEDYDEKGKLARTQTRTYGPKDEGPVEHYTPTKILIVDHRRNGHSTELEMLSVKVNQKVPDSAFSQRALVRGN